MPLTGSWTGRAQGGLGLELARSSYENAGDVPRRSRENDWAPTASLGLSAARPLAGGQLAAGIGTRFARHAFAAHSFEVLHGVELSVAYGRSF